ncbi:DMT family transporter [Albimonas sp. CAU 1670]|uniref:DMT family transporter n=1 Tax=Albimonas sp. CAU 1670 TaxID=3032599 RepID=UPI0023DBC772|nr:DMT family transporter [Albimonas sp. CAU 1670]MDF2234450.1 DMT family transporter [Albimonas sp. CAU 1670]
MTAAPPPPPPATTAEGGAAHRLRLVALGAVAALGFGVSFPLNHVAVEAASPIAVAMLRALVAAPALALGLRLMGVPAPRGARAWRASLLLGALSTAIPFILLAAGQALIGGGLGGVVFATIPMIVVLAAPLLPPFPRIEARRLPGCAVGLAGVTLATGGGGEGAALGVAMTFAAAACLAVGSILLQRFPDLDPRSLTLGQVTCGAAMLVPTALLWPGVQIGPALAPVPFAAIAANGILSTAAAMCAMYMLIRAAGPASAATINFYTPLIAIVVSAATLGEPLSPILLAAFGLVTLGAWLVARRR